MTKSSPENKSSPEPRVDHKLMCALEKLVRTLGLVNGTITISARGGQLCRGIEILNKIDVAQID